MKIVIDIPDEDIDAIKYLQKNGFASRHELAILNGIPFPNNLTNGDMIKAIFPNARIFTFKEYVVIDIAIQQIAIWNEWWNAPYKQKEDFEWGGEGD